MKYKILFFAICLYSPILAVAQPNDYISRKSGIERCMQNIYSISDFQRIADSLQMSISEMCNYPVFSPVKQPVISSCFGWRRHPIRRVRQFHTGIDIPKAKGTPVYATGNGVVICKGYDSGYGYFIEIAHAGNFRSFYAHQSRIMVNIGDSVRIAEQIGCVGNTGISTGNHLHYEIRKGNHFLNPIGWCYCLYDILKKRI